VTDSKLTFLLFFTVTRLTPVIGFMPSFSMALRLFFSLLLCFDLPLASPSCPEYEKMKTILVRSQGIMIDPQTKLKKNS